MSQCSMIWLWFSSLWLQLLIKKKVAWILILHSIFMFCIFRNCGNIFCHDCSNHYSPIPHQNLSGEERVCVKCYTCLQNKLPYNGMIDERPLAAAASNWQITDLDTYEIKSDSISLCTRQHLYGFYSPWVHLRLLRNFWYTILKCWLVSDYLKYELMNCIFI